VNAADAAVLRELLEVPRVAALGVLVEGTPYVGLVPFAVGADRQALFVHASRLARHTRGLLAGAPFSALVHAPEAPASDPLQLPRVTFLGTVAPLAGAAEADARTRYLARFPDAEQTFALPDFALYALRIREGRLVAGFARARDVSPGDLQGL
jgi:putative heme iron utilization protein